MLLVILSSANCVVANNWKSVGDDGKNDMDKGAEEPPLMGMALKEVPVFSSTYVDHMVFTPPYISLESVEYPIIQINVKLGDRDGKEDVRQYEYTARVYNSSQEQFGEDIVLKLNGNPDNSLSPIARGTAYLPSNIPEGYYYVFVYQNDTNSESPSFGEYILPFMCKSNENSISCCNESSCMTSLICGEDIIFNNCSDSWCCGCNCTESKNSFYIEKEGSENGGSDNGDDGGDDNSGDDEGDDETGDDGGDDNSGDDGGDDNSGNDGGDDNSGDDGGDDNSGDDEGNDETGDDEGNEGTSDDSTVDEGSESIDDGEYNADDGDKPLKRRSSADRGTLPIRKKETTESFSLPPETRMASNPGLSIKALANEERKNEGDDSEFDRLILYFLASMFALLLALCGSIFSRYSKLRKE